MLFASELSCESPNLGNYSLWQWLDGWFEATYGPRTDAVRAVDDSVRTEPSLRSVGRTLLSYTFRCRAELGEGEEEREPQQQEQEEGLELVSRS